MESITPYFFFQGNCEEATSFYHDCLGGKLEIKRFGESDMPVGDDYKNKIMHAELTLENGLKIMFSDGAPHKKVSTGNHIQINIGFEDEKETETVFNKLAEDGKITMPLEVTFWNAKFGMLVDKYGIQWMVNCPVTDS